MTRHKTSLFELERGKSPPAGRMRAQGLLALERHCSGERRPAAVVSAQSYDGGEAIAVQTSRGRFPLIPQRVVASRAARPFAAAFAAGAAYGDAAWVEPFDEPALDAVPAPDPAEPFPTRTPEEERLAQAPAITLPPAPQAPPVSGDELDDDIRAVLERAAEQPAPPPVPEPVIAKPAPPPAEAPAPALALAHPHAIFDAMSSGLGHATTFDLGRVDLNRRLHDIERELDAEEAVAPRIPPRRAFSGAAALDDDDLVEDLSAVSSLLEQKLREETAKPPETVKAPPTVQKTPEPTAARPAPAAPEPAPRPATTQYTVPRFAATATVTAPAAAAAMLVAWRDGQPADADALAAGSGHWATYRPALSFADPAFFDTWGLLPQEPAPLTSAALTTLLADHGPLWLQDPQAATQVVVVTGIDADGSRVAISDPAATAANETLDIPALAGRLGGGPVRIAWIAGKA